MGPLSFLLSARESSATRKSPRRFQCVVDLRGSLGIHFFRLFFLLARSLPGVLGDGPLGDGCHVGEEGSFVDRKCRRDSTLPVLGVVPTSALRRGPALKNMFRCVGGHTQHQETPGRRRDRNSHFPISLGYLLREMAYPGLAFVAEDRSWCHGGVTGGVTATCIGVRPCSRCLPCMSWLSTVPSVASGGALSRGQLCWGHQQTTGAIKTTAVISVTGLIAEQNRNSYDTAGSSTHRTHRYLILSV